MIAYFKRQWLRLKESWKAFKREWRFNYADRKDHELVDGSFIIKGIAGLKGYDPYDYFRDDSFDMKPPYYGMALTRVNGTVFTLKYIHYNKETKTIRYLDTNVPEEGFVVLDEDLMNKFWIGPLEETR